MRAPSPAAIRATVISTLDNVQPVGVGCPGCGGPNPPGAAVCQWCGASIPQPVAPPVQPGPSTVIITEREPSPGGDARRGE